MNSHDEAIYKGVKRTLQQARVKVREHARLATSEQKKQLDLIGDELQMLITGIDVAVAK